MTYTEHPIISVDRGGETWRVFRRDFEGIRVSHGEYEEWPIKVPILGFRWNSYTFNGKRSMPSPNTPGAIPEEVTGIVRSLLHA